MHRLDERVLITPMLLKRFSAEAEFENGDGFYCAFIQRSNGTFLEHAEGPGADPMQELFATDMLNALNGKLHHDGAWVMLFTHHDVPVPPLAKGIYRRFVILWMDRDGDVQFPIENDEPLHVVLAKGPDHWLEQCETAYALWHHAMREVLNPREGNLYRRARGETAPSLH